MSLNTWGGYTPEDEQEFLQGTQYIRDELGSETIDSGMRYSSQAETVRQCLREAFGEYADDIRLVNAFFLELDFFMRQLKELNLYQWKQEGEHTALSNAIAAGDRIKWNILKYGDQADVRMEKDLEGQWKSHNEQMEIINGRYDKFLGLLRGRIRYED